MRVLSSNQSKAKSRGEAGPGRPRRFISLDHVSFRLGEEVIFPGLTWCWEGDEHWAIIGRNGSGKSLLADGLRGRLAATGGEVRYHFRPPAGLTAEEAMPEFAAGRLESAVALTGTITMPKPIPARPMVHPSVDTQTLGLIAR